MAGGEGEDGGGWENFCEERVDAPEKEFERLDSNTVPFPRVIKIGSK